MRALVFGNYKIQSMKMMFYLVERRTWYCDIESYRKNSTGKPKPLLM